MHLSGVEPHDIAADSQAIPAFPSQRRVVDVDIWGFLRRLPLELTPATIVVAFAGVFLICFMKGAFGGGFSIIGIPLLSIVMDPVTAGGLLAPLFIAMDLF